MFVSFVPVLVIKLEGGRFHVIPLRLQAMHRPETTEPQAREGGHSRLANLYRLASNPGLN
jgi:hypothetical protein